MGKCDNSLVNLMHMTFGKIVTFSGIDFCFTGDP